MDNDALLAAVAEAVKAPLADLSKQMNHFRKDLGNKVDRLGDEVNCLRDEVNRLGDKVDDLEDKVDDLGNKVDDLDQRVTFVGSIASPLMSLQMVLPVDEVLVPGGTADKLDGATSTYTFACALVHGKERVVAVGSGHCSFYHCSPPAHVTFNAFAPVYVPPKIAKYVVKVGFPVDLKNKVKARLAKNDIVLLVLADDVQEYLAELGLTKESLPWLEPSTTPFDASLRFVAGASTSKGVEGTTVMQISTGNYDGCIAFHQMAGEPGNSGALMRGFTNPWDAVILGVYYGIIPTASRHKCPRGVIVPIPQLTFGWLVQGEGTYENIPAKLTFGTFASATSTQVLPIPLKVTAERNDKGHPFVFKDEHGYCGVLLDLKFPIFKCGSIDCASIGCGCPRGPENGAAAPLS